MSRTVSLLDLAREIARKHERGGAGAITIIPVIVDNLNSALPILDALCQLNDGRLLNTQEPEFQGPVLGTTDPVRRDAIINAMGGEPTIPRHVRLEDKEGGLIDASFVEPPAVSPSLGERTVLAVVRAAAHRDLDTYRFAVVAYSEGAVDLPFRRRIWKLAVDHLNNMPHQTLQTLVFVAESEIDIDLHCKTGRGFQLAVNGDRLMRRKGADALQAEAAFMARHPRPFVLFLGAGFATSSGLPLGNAMRDRAIRRLLNMPAEEPWTSIDLATRFHGWVAERGWLSRLEAEMPQDQFVAELTVERVVRAEQRMDPSLPTLRDFKIHHDRVIKAPGQAVLDLAAVLEQGVGRIVVVEVNFDLLVETHATIQLRVFASEEEFSEAPEFLRRYMEGDEEAIPILKLHGTISNPEACVVSAEQTERGVGQRKMNALRALLNGEHPRLWIYVGASLRDLDLRPLLLGEEFARGVDERWVSPYLADSVERFAIYREPIWRDSDFRSVEERLITETADAFFAALRNAWGRDIAR